MSRIPNRNECFMVFNCPKHGDMLGAFCGHCDPRGVAAAWEEEARLIDEKLAEMRAREGK